MRGTGRSPGSWRRVARAHSISRMSISSRAVRHSLAVAVLLAAVLASLGSSSHPSINAAAKSDLDRRLAGLQPAARTVPAPTVAEPAPLAPGQWVAMKVTDQDGHPSIQTLKITGQQDGAFWYEVSTDSYYGHMAMKMLLAIGDRRDPKTFDIRSVTMRDYHGRVTEMPPSMLGMIKTSYQSALDQLVIKWDQLPQENMQVLGGSFTGCYKARTTAELAGQSTTSDVWFHSAVPINGLVKSVGVDRPFTQELVDFGFEGATSEF
jgi:hypothetical protein